MNRTSWIACGLVLASRLIAWIITQDATEDALITFRVAGNWIAHGFPSFNVGSHAGSVTSLPWTAWIAGGLLLGFPPLLWARVTSLACDAAVLALVSRETLPGFALVFALPLFSYGSVSGMETSAVTAALFAASRFPWGNAILASLRPEGFIAAAVLGAFKRGWWALAAGSGLVVAGLSFWLWGDPAPTLAVKRAVYGLHPFGGWLWVSPIAPLDLGGSPLGILQHMDGLRLLWAPAILFGALESLALAIPALVILIGLWACGVAGFWWYVVPWYAALASVGTQGVRQMALPWAVKACAVLVVLSLWVPGFMAMRATVAAERNLKAVALKLRELKASGRVFTEPMGHIGWENPDLRVIDEVGLATPDVADLRTGPPGWWATVVRDSTPEWIVARLSFLQNPSKAWAGVGTPIIEGDQPVKCYKPVGQVGDVLILQRVVGTADCP